jgi:hypothetical protein
MPAIDQLDIRSLENTCTNLLEKSWQQYLSIIHFYVWILSREGSLMNIAVASISPVSSCQPTHSRQMGSSPNHRQLFTSRGQHKSSIHKRDMPLLRSCDRYLQQILDWNSIAIARRSHHAQKKCPLTHLVLHPPPAFVFSLHLVLPWPASQYSWPQMWHYLYDLSIDGWKLNLRVTERQCKPGSAKGTSCLFLPHSSHLFGSPNQQAGTLGVSVIFWQ